jgi:hypothetical protein
MAETECAVVSYSKSGWLTSEMGHSRPMPPILPTGSCPLRPPKADKLSRRNEMTRWAKSDNPGKDAVPGRVHPVHAGRSDRKKPTIRCRTQVEGALLTPRIVPRIAPLKMPAETRIARGTDGWLWPTRRKSIIFTGDTGDGAMPVRSSAEKADRFAVCFMSSSADVTLATCSTRPPS